MKKYTGKEQWGQMFPVPHLIQYLGRFFNVFRARKILYMIFGVIFLGLTEGYGQNNVFAFFEYEIRKGMEDQFVKGYAKDLEWHQSQEDDWSWIGWFVTNGDRKGCFIDATPNHAWKDFDNWKVDASENMRHNKIHWLPYVGCSSGSYRVVMEEYSKEDSHWYKSRYLQVYHIQVHHGREHLFAEFLEGIKPVLENKLQGRSFVWMKTVSGGGVETYLLFLALDRIEDLGLCERLVPTVVPGEKVGKYKGMIKEMISELWTYDPKLSLFPQDRN